MTSHSSRKKNQNGDPLLIEHPPTSVMGILRRLGPGLIVAGSIVGSGELIATTKTGAEAGFTLLWLILIGCVIKVFVQVEFGRYSIVNGKTTLSGLNQVPGPKIHIQGATASANGNWIVWYWFLMFLASIGQLGGIVGGVGQALMISYPITENGREYRDYMDAKLKLNALERDLGHFDQTGQLTFTETAEDARNEIEELEKIISDQKIKFGKRRVEEQGGDSGSTDQQTLIDLGGQQLDQLGDRVHDDKYWAGLIAVLTAAVLVVGRYGFIQTFATIMVASFTLITVINLAALQWHDNLAVSWKEFAEGLSFRLPESKEDGKSAIATALATFGIIGVGASELVVYPYWCLEKGYARFTGPRDSSPEWAQRAQGWMRVMRWDAWCSMVVYTFATLAFYLLGAAILSRHGLNPEKSDMVRTLAVMYEPVFKGHARELFLFGAFAVLYSTFFVANASHARTFSDALRVLGFAPASEKAYRRRVRLLSGVFPLLCFAVYVVIPRPAKLVLLSGLMQAMMLPMLAFAALYFRYQRCDKRIRPGLVWDGFLVISALGMLIAGVWALISHLG